MAHEDSSESHHEHKKEVTSDDLEKLFHNFSGKLIRYPHDDVEDLMTNTPEGRTAYALHLQVPPNMIEEAFRMNDPLTRVIKAPINYYEAHRIEDYNVPPELVLDIHTITYEGDTPPHEQHTLYIIHQIAPNRYTATVSVMPGAPNEGMEFEMMNLNADLTTRKLSQHDLVSMQRLYRLVDGLPA